MKQLATLMLAMVATCCLASDSSLNTMTPVAPVFESSTVKQSADPVPEVQQAVKIQTEQVTFDSRHFHLEGVLIKPSSPGPHPTIVFVHGDGPVNRDGYGMYKPMWKRFVNMGYACLSWDKPGVGGSTGHFSSYRKFEERAGIVTDAIRFLKGRTDVDNTRIGLWGISEAGYVLPMVCSGNPDVAFLIAVSTPTTNPITHTAYRIGEEIRRAGMGDAAARTYAWYYKQREQAESYEEYLRYAKTLNRNPIVRDRLGLGNILDREQFVAASRHRDNQMEPMQLLEKISIPVLTVFGGRDTQIAVKETIRHYRIAMRKAGNTHFRIVRLDQADHMIFSSLTGSIQEMRDNLVSGAFRLAPGYLRGMENFLMTLNRMARN